ncbi:putative tyrosine transporter P-protein [Cohnella sp. SGD-V74]|nr:putative tyrosine transporter P-protein [Cohnella sp. SGD-V74]
MYLTEILIAVSIFLSTYAIIISEKINRAVIALTGALLMVLLGLVDFHAAYTHHIEWKTLFLLIGMMILVGITNRSGIFQYIAIKAAQRAKGEPVKILVTLALLTAVGSAFIDNVTTVLLIVPITFSITRLLKLNPIPFLITEIMICNIGGAATLVGDPPNIMIGTAANLSFNQFLVNMTPVIIVIMIVIMFYLKRLYGKQMKVSDEDKEKLMNIDAASYIKDAALMKKSLFVFALTIIGFLTHRFFHIEPAVVAFAGATLLMLIGTKEKDLEEVFHTVEWVTIFFFAGLFVLVGGLIEVGVIKQMATALLNFTEGDLTSTSMIILWGAGIASALIDNIPLVATLIPMVMDMGAQLGLSEEALLPIWWSLALGACLGGNGTLIASSANLIVAGIAAREGKRISFIEFMKVGIPVTLISMSIATVYVYFVLL